MVRAVSFTVLLYKFQIHIRKVRCSTLWLLRIVDNKRNKHLWDEDGRL